MLEPGGSIRQVSLGLSRQAGELVTAEKANDDARAADLNAMQASLLSSCPLWPYDLHRRACPYPMVIPQSRLLDLQELHRLLSSAITNIVERWWIDKDARFPERMPVEKHEEDVLRWMNSLSETVLLPIRKCQGSWRPDFLLENAESKELYRICEINSRFAFNGFLHTAFGQQAYINMDDKKSNLATPAADPKEILDGLLSLFNPSLPLYLLKGEEAGADIHLFISYVRSITGRSPTLITPSDLRLVLNPSSPTGYTLYCAAGVDAAGSEVLKRVHQVGLELHQRELRSISTLMLREISLCCFNDLRTIFLVHDKRMLGIVLQELDSLVGVHGVLTSAQAEIVRRGITPTIIPGSCELMSMIRSSENRPTIKNDLLLKPIRSGKGAGIIFGSDMAPDAWMSQLLLLRNPAITPGQLTYVIQRKIQQPQFDVVLHEAEGLQHNYLVGTYMSIHGRYLGLGLWRTSADRICALSRGGAWICSVVPPESKSLRYQM